MEMVALIGRVLDAIRIGHVTLLLVKVSIHLGNVRCLITVIMFNVVALVVALPTVVLFGILGSKAGHQIRNGSRLLIVEIVATHGQFSFVR